MRKDRTTVTYCIFPCMLHSIIHANCRQGGNLMDQTNAVHSQMPNPFPSSSLRVCLSPYFLLEVITQPVLWCPFTPTRCISSNSSPWLSDDSLLPTQHFWVSHSISPQWCPDYSTIYASFSVNFSVRQWLQSLNTWIEVSKAEMPDWPESMHGSCCPGFSLIRTSGQFCRKGKLSFSKG